MTFLIVYDGDKLKWCDNKLQAEHIAEVMSNKNIDSCFNEYEIYKDGMTERRIAELSVISGVENREVRIISLKSLIKRVSESYNLNLDEKENLIYELKTNRYDYVDDYINLDEVIYSEF